MTRLSVRSTRSAGSTFDSSVSAISCPIATIGWRNASEPEARTGPRVTKRKVRPVQLSSEIVRPRLRACSSLIRDLKTSSERACSIFCCGQMSSIENDALCSFQLERAHRNCSKYLRVSRAYFKDLVATVGFCRATDRKTEEDRQNTTVVTTPLDVLVKRSVRGPEARIIFRPPRLRFGQSGGGKVNTLYATNRPNNLSDFTTFGSLMIAHSGSFRPFLQQLNARVGTQRTDNVARSTYAANTCANLNYQSILLGCG